MPAFPKKHPGCEGRRRWEETRSRLEAGGQARRAPLTSDAWPKVSRIIYLSNLYLLDVPWFLGKKWFIVGNMVGLRQVLGFPSHSVGRSTCSAEDAGSIMESGRKGHGSHSSDLAWEIP